MNQLIRCSCVPLFQVHRSIARTGELSLVCVNPNLPWRVGKMSVKVALQVALDNTALQGQAPALKEGGHLRFTSFLKKRQTRGSRDVLTCPRRGVITIPLPSLSVPLKKSRQHRSMSAQLIILHTCSFILLQKNTSP